MIKLNEIFEDTGEDYGDINDQNMEKAELLERLDGMAFRLSYILEQQKLEQRDFFEDFVKKYFPNKFNFYTGKEKYWKRM